MSETQTTKKPILPVGPRKVPDDAKPEAQFEACFVDDPRLIRKVTINGAEFSMRSLTSSEAATVIEAATRDEGDSAAWDNEDTLEAYASFIDKQVEKLEQQDKLAAQFYARSLMKTIDQSTLKRLTVTYALGGYTKLSVEGWSFEREVDEQGVDRLREGFIDELYEA